MGSEKRLLEVLIAISTISNDKRMRFQQKLKNILQEIVQCMEAERGSVSLLKGRRKLEVVASTSEKLIGTKQSLDNDSPSAWVVKYKAPLYIDNISKSNAFTKRFDNYKGEAFLLVPIISNEKVMGVLSVTDKIGKDLFSKDEQTILLNVTGQMISALENQRLSDDLRKKRRALQKKNLQLKKLERLKTELFNMLIHDLKGPISELMANLDILSYTASSDNQEYVESAKNGCDTLYRMVSNLLDIARLEEDRLELLYERIDPRDILQESLARLFGLGSMKEITFSENCPEAINLDHFWGDRGILLRVLQNLLTNAIHYSPSGEQIEVGFYYPSTLEIEFFVKDAGPGVPDEYQKAIFDKYFQLEKKGDGRVYTAGLGLNFCKMAVEAHNGKIGVEVGEKKGSRFFFKLPLEIKKAAGSS
jgi:two-component system sensor histidine kinase KdpD